MESGLLVMLMILIVLWCSLMMSHNYGIAEAAKTLKTEHKLALIKEPSFKIIKSIYGDQYECMDFYKQPGFGNTSMNNHTYYKMRMMSNPERSKLQRETLSNKTFGHLWENGVGCPIGMVPILKVTKDNLSRLKSLGGDNSSPQGSWTNNYKPMSPSDGHHFAVVRTKKGPKVYNGASMSISIETPQVTPNQFSSARMHVQMGDEYIQTGWTVHPRLYNDGRSRLFVFTKAGGHECYHTKCPSGAGMIQVRQDLAPGLPFVDGRVDLALTKDQINGNWWLSFGGEEVGFWPSNRFKESSGTKVEWGGEVYSPSFPSPPMGNGRFPGGNPNKDSYIRLISILDGNYKRDNTVENTERFSDNTHGYKVTDATQTWWRDTGHLVLYGGPGNI